MYNIQFIEQAVGSETVVTLKRFTKTARLNFNDVMPK